MRIQNRVLCLTSHWPVPCMTPTVTHCSTQARARFFTYAVRANYVIAVGRGAAIWWIKHRVSVAAESLIIVLWRQSALFFKRRRVAANCRALTVFDDVLHRVVWRNPTDVATTREQCVDHCACVVWLVRWFFWLTRRFRVLLACLLSLWCMLHFWLVCQRSRWNVWFMRVNFWLLFVLVV